MKNQCSKSTFVTEDLGLITCQCCDYRIRQRACLNKILDYFAIFLMFPLSVFVYKLFLKLQANTSKKFFFAKSTTFVFWFHKFCIFIVSLYLSQLTFKKKLELGFLTYYHVKITFLLIVFRNGCDFIQTSIYSVAFLLFMSI